MSNNVLGFLIAIDLFIAVLIIATAIGTAYCWLSNKITEIKEMNKVCNRMATFRKPEPKLDTYIPRAMSQYLQVT